MPSVTPEAPQVIETTGEEIPPSLRPRRTENPSFSPPEPRPDVVPFASTLRHLAPDTPFRRVPA